ncbi:MAG: hypothetical protein R3C26_09655 [Calditrichia bacterium]
MVEQFRFGCADGLLHIDQQRRRQTETSSVAEKVQSVMMITK